SALSWPRPWNGGVPSPCSASVPMRGLMGSQSSRSIAAGAYVILQFVSNPPTPSDYGCFGSDQSHFCLLSRIETSASPPYGMTTAEGPDLNATSETTTT